MVDLTDILKKRYCKSYQIPITIPAILKSDTLAEGYFTLTIIDVIPTKRLVNRGRRVFEFYYRIDPPGFTKGPHLKSIIHELKTYFHVKVELHQVD
jgi:hypothetical protein